MSVTRACRALTTTRPSARRRRVARVAADNLPRTMLRSHCMLTIAMDAPSTVSRKTKRKYFGREYLT